MNENIDLTKILKGCPIGWVFYSSVYGNVIFRRIENSSDLPIKFFFTGKDNVERCGRVTEQGLDSPLYNGECTFFPSKDQRDWSKFVATWRKKEKFNPKTLKVFDKVLVKDIHSHHWHIGIFSNYIENDTFPYKCVGNNYKLCIPYNDDTKHLLGTDDKVPEYYRYWED